MQSRQHLLRVITTLGRLGVGNVLAVAWYRLKHRTGYFKLRTPLRNFRSVATHGLWNSTEQGELASLPLEYFGNLTAVPTDLPDWLYSPYSDQRVNDNGAHWSRLPDFNLPVGDIKVLWEASRFDWLLKACWKTQENSRTAPFPIQICLADWCAKNPPNQGVHWKCAQETAIRAMHTMVAARVDNNSQLPESELLGEFLLAHIRRILPTLSYACAQNNNHGTSEAAALYTLGIALQRRSPDAPAPLARRAERIGRKLLEERVRQLITATGTFSQYSVVYHRMMLDTLAFAECCRRACHRAPFSPQFYLLATAATDWLIRMTDPKSGDAPNIGANDGAHLFNLTGDHYRDFRPSCQLASVVFKDTSVFNHSQHGLLTAFGLKPNGDASKSRRPSVICEPLDTTNSQATGSHIHCGFARLGEATTFAVLKTPVDTFRPSQADALHLDVWHEGINLIRDAGTYSYNPPVTHTEDLAATRCHSTIEFDGQDQMPRIGRFLYADWLPTCDATATTEMIDGRHHLSIGSHYDNQQGHHHERRVTRTATGFKITDTISGMRDHAILRWRLPPHDWTRCDNTVASALASISVTAGIPIECQLTESVESLHYLSLSTVPVFAITIPCATTVVTAIELH